MSNTDDLLLPCLDALTTYQTHLASLTAHLSSGFLALADARFHSATPTHTGAACHSARGDPRAWFGILTDPRLRAAQGDFGAGVAAARAVLAARGRVCGLLDAVEGARAAAWVYAVRGRLWRARDMRAAVAAAAVAEAEVRVVKVPVAAGVRWVWREEEGEAVPLMEEGAREEGEERVFVDGEGEWAWVE